MQNLLLQVEQPSLLTSMMPLLLMVAVMYFLLMRPQKKREKQAQEMRNALEVGDEIVTIGGILGRVVTVREDSLLIESGSANTKLRITKAAVQSNLTASENARARQQEAAQKAQEAKEQKAREKAEAKEAKKNKTDA